MNSKTFLGGGLFESARDVGGVFALRGGGGGVGRFVVPIVAIWTLLSQDSLGGLRKVCFSF